MTYVVSAKLVGDASSLKAAAAEGKAAIDGVGESAGRLKGSVGEGRAAIEEIDAAAGKLTGSAGDARGALDGVGTAAAGLKAPAANAKSEVAGLGATIGGMKSDAGQGRVALDALGGTAGKVGTSVSGAASSTSGMSNATRSLQVAVRDSLKPLGTSITSLTSHGMAANVAAAATSTGAAATSRATRVTVTYAGGMVISTGATNVNTGATVSNTQATVAATSAKLAFANLMGGLWAGAVSGAIMLVGQLVTGLLSSGKQTDEAARSTDVHKMSTKELTDALGELDEALKKQTQTSQQAETQAYRTAEGLVNEAKRRREVAKSALQQAAAELAAANIRSADPTLAGEGGFNPGFAEGTLIARQISALEAQIKILDVAIQTRGAALARSALPILQREVAEATDKTARINGDYERTLARLNGQLTRHTIKTAEYRRELEKATKARDAALEAARNEEQQANRTNRDAGRTIAFLNPVGGSISSGFGPRAAPKAGASTFHQGLDFAVPSGTAVRAPAVGTVEAVGFDTKLGKYVVIDHGAGTKTKFGHLSDTDAVRVGTQLAAGDVFARSGNTGNSTGPHLHYSVLQGGKYVDPRKGRFKADAGDAALDGESDVARETKRLADEAKREADEARRAIEELERSLGVIVGAFDPAKAAAEKYADQIERIAELNRKGFLSDGQAIGLGLEASRQDLERRKKADAALIDRVTGGDFAKSWEETMAAADTRVGARAAAALEKAGKRGGEAFEERGVQAAEAIARLLGGKIGDAAGDAFAILGGLKTGNFNSVGGPLGSILTLLGGEGKPGDKPDLFNEGLKEFVSPIKHGLKDVVTKIGDTFKIGGDFEKTLGHVAGGAALGAVVGPAVTKLLGIRGSKSGATIGGGVGAAAGAASGIPGGQQIGALIGSVMGSAVGGFFKSAKTGSATITNTTGDLVIGGNNSGSKESASTLGKNVQSALGQIAEQLGGTLGAFSVSIGMKDGKFRVDPTGKGNVKTKKGALDFGDDHAAAQAAALADAIADGAVIGLSEKVQAALRSTKDIDRALREAMKVDELETLMEGLGGTLSKPFRDFERQAAERLRIARQYGFDVLKVEKLNAEERVKLTEQVLGSRIGVLKDLISSIDFGDLFEGSISDQIARLKDESGKAKADAEAGLEGAAERFAGLERSIIEKTMEGFGTAGPELGAARSEAKSASQRIIELENSRMKASQDATKETNNQLNEVNDQLSEQNTILRRVETAIAAIGFGGGGSRSEGASTRFEASLTL